MAPTEQTILTTFLLTPAPLPTILSLQSFTALFPRIEQSSPEIRRLYRSLQHRRALLTDAVAQDIEQEVKRGNAQRRAVIRARRVEEKDELDEEVAVENALFGSTSNLPVSRPHTLTSILEDLDVAAKDVAAEIQALEYEAERLLADITATVSGLSDLRYGKFANSNLKEEVMQGLNGLEVACATK